MSSTATVRRDVLPGYETVEQIGSGGYGEVFRAVAPGGIEKAVKVLHGYFDDECAARELKALERVKELRHPFLLSLERFEVVDGRLVVVTELAEGSLDDVFLACRREGQTGIPRDQLLDYLRDAADALDYMQQQHGLQHLDVKPENLLIVGGHVKVADFGLVKDIARATQKSLMGGMTPTYAAPELFDNAPGPRSDQYSLAIVYQELLTGTLPFPGQTAAQLVAQHTQAVPLTASLPEHDQAIILRALAKDPLKRYPSCQDLIRALHTAAGDAAGEREAAKPTGDWPASSGAADDTKESSSHATQVFAAAATDSAEWPGVDSSASSQPAATQRLAKPGSSPAAAPQSMPLRRCKPASDAAVHAVPKVSVTQKIVDEPVPEFDPAVACVRPTLLIGVGGQGARVLQRLGEQLSESDPQETWRQHTAMLCIDTDRDDIRLLQQNGSLAETCLLPLKLPQHYRNRSSGILNWLSRRWFYNIPRSLETGGFRPLGRLALIDNAEAALAQLDRSLSHVAAELDLPDRQESSTERQPPRVVVVASTSGGTGSGIAVDLAWAIRNWGVEHESALQLTGIFGDAYSGGCDGRDLAQVNTLAFLREYSSVARTGNASSDGTHETAGRFEGAGSPFDHAYFVGAGRDEKRRSVEEWTEQIALYLEAYLTGAAAGPIEACRAATPPDMGQIATSDRLYTLTATPLDQQRESIVQAARQRLCLLAIGTWSRRRPQLDENSDPTNSKGLRRLRRGRTPQRRTGTATQQQATARLEAFVQQEFGDAHATIFATQLIAVLGENLDDLERRRPATETPGAVDPLLQLVRYAFQQYTESINKIRADALAEAPLSTRCLKSADPQPATDPTEGLGEAAAELAAEIAQQACINYLTALAIGQKPWVLNLGGSLDHAVTKAIDQLRRLPDGLELLEDLAGYEADLTGLIEQSENVAPGCGYQRRTIALFGAASAGDTLQAEVKKLLPQAAIVHGQNARPLLIREGQGLSLAQVAASLYQERPDLLKAACRLQTRNDVDWLPLPEAVPPEAVPPRTVER